MVAPRRLTVMVSLDVAGFTRLVQEDERAALTEVAAIRRELIDPTLQPRSGNVFRTMGDGALIEFPNVEDAVSWTIEFQEVMADRMGHGNAARGRNFLEPNQIGDCGARSIVAIDIDIGKGNAGANQDQLLRVPQVSIRRLAGLPE